MRTKHTKAWLLVAILAVSITMVYTDVTVAQPAAVLESHLVDGPLPVADPESPMWDEVTPVEIPLAGQGTTEPVRLQPSTPNVRVRSLTNATHIAFRISWSDGSVNNRTTLSQEFRDAMAIMLAPSGPADICMGSRGQRIHIVHWKADWQADLEEGFHDLQHAFPNFWVDHYPYAVGDPPYRLPDAFPPGTARDQLVGWSVGNLFSDPVKLTAVEDAVAQGFGTIATQDRQDVLGRGVWENDEWSVIIYRKLNTGDPEDLELVPGGRYIVAMAVWDGDEGDVGARKSVTGSWTTFQVTGAAEIAPIWVWALVGVPPAMALLFIWHILRRRKGA